MNTMRVFLHDLVWQQDSQGYRQRIDRFLTIASRHGIRPMFVLFDSVWDPFPAIGPQRAPKPGVHNSGWMQGPGATGVVHAFAKDKRVLAWDIWNEPDNRNGSSYRALEPPEKAKIMEQILPRAFAWARAARPSQPLTSGLWQHDDWTPGAKLTPVERIQADHSDVISFHDYNAGAAGGNGHTDSLCVRRPGCEAGGNVHHALAPVTYPSFAVRAIAAIGKRAFCWRD